jgi:hypothetical protein
MVRILRSIGKIQKLNTDPLERDVEEGFRKKVKAAGGKAWKFTSPANRSVPDRLVVLPGYVWCPHVFLVELKRKGKKPTPAQQDEIGTFRALGVRVYVADSTEQCEEILAFEIAVFGAQGTGHATTKRAARTPAQGTRLAREKTLRGALSRHGAWKDLRRHLGLRGDLRKR